MGLISTGRLHLNKRHREARGPWYTSLMKLVTFRTHAHDRAGILAADGTIIDLAHAFAWFEHEAGRRCGDLAVTERYGKGVLGFVEHAAEARLVADAIVARLAEKKLPAVFDGRMTTHALRDVTLRAPLPRPPSMRDGYAFRQHVETARKNRGLDMIPEFDQFPVFYFTNHQAVVGPGELHVQSRHLDKLDFELEA